MKYLHKDSPTALLVGLSLLVFSLSFAYYCFVYIPTRNDQTIKRQNQEVYEKAATECDEEAEKLGELPNGGLETVDELVNRVKANQNLKVMIEETRPKCITNKLIRWGYDSNMIVNNR